jgi:hypothetical protein
LKSTCHAIAGFVCNVSTEWFDVTTLMKTTLLQEGSNLIFTDANIRFHQEQKQSNQSREPKERVSKRGMLKKENVYTYHGTKVPQYVRDPLSAVREIPSKLDSWSSLYGIYTLQERCILPPHGNPAPILQKHKKYLFARKAKLCDPSFRLERGMCYNEIQFGPFLKLAPISTNIPDRKRNENAVFISSSSVEATPHIPIHEHYFQNKNIPGWVIYVKKGKIEDQSPSFLKFDEAIHHLKIQPVATWLLEQISQWMYAYAIPIIAVNCEILIQYSLQPLKVPLAQEIMLNCIFNREEVAKLVVKPGQKFKHPKRGRHDAATLIQFTFRNYRTKLHRNRIILELKSAKMIQMHWNRYLKRKKFFVTHQMRLADNVERFKKYQECFLNTSDEFLTPHRTVVYICSSELEEGKRLDIARTFPLYYKPSLRYILVLSREIVSLNEQVMDMYDCEHHKSPLDNQNIKVFKPKLLPFIQEKIPIGATLYFCAQSLALLKKMTMGLDLITSHPFVWH